MAEEQRNHNHGHQGEDPNQRENDGKGHKDNGHHGQPPVIRKQPGTSHAVICHELRSGK